MQVELSAQSRGGSQCQVVSVSVVWPSLWWTKARGLAVGLNGGDSLSEIGRSVRRSPEQMLVREPEDREVKVRELWEKESVPNLVLAP